MRTNHIYFQELKHVLGIKKAPNFIYEIRREKLIT
jgi:hypothetical protein